MSRFPLPAAALAQHVIALGKTRSGKSSKMRVIVEQLLEHEKPVCIIDPKGDWWGLKSSADGKHAGYPIVIFGGDHADVPLTAHAGAAVAELIATGNRPALIDLGGWMVGDRTRFFIEFAATFFKLTRGARYLVIDEVHNFAPQGRVMDPDAGKMLHWANRLASEGAGKGVTLIAASQRPQKVHKDFVTSCETLIACRVVHKLDRDAIKDWIDGCADPAMGRQVLAELAGMKREEAWVWSPEINFGPERITWPMFRTYDSFKPQAADAGKLKGWAEVDLEDVRGKLTAAIKEAEANDPKRLRARIAELERQATKGAPAPAPGKAASREELKAAEDRGYRRGADQECKTIVAALHRWQKSLKGQIHQALELALREIALPDELGKDPGNYPVTSRKEPASAAPPAPRATPALRSSGNGDMPPELAGLGKRVLDALAWLAAKGIEPAPRATVAAVAHVKPRGGYYARVVGNLKTSGYVEYPGDGTIALTDSGRSYADAGDGSGEVHEQWLEILTGLERKLIEVLIERHGESLTREQLAQAAAVDEAGGYFSRVVGHLKTLGAIDYPQKGHVALTRHVMPDG